MRAPISVLLPTYNNAKIIRNTLESVKWAEEILVVDSFSTDETVAICKEYGARIVQHEYINSAKQKNWAIPQCSYAWVLQIDTDETLEPGLKEEIEECVAAAPDHVDAFRIPRKNHMLGRWQRYGGNYPDFQTRLLRKGKAHWQDREVHAHVEVVGTIADLQRHILHDNMPALTREWRNLDRYSRYEADELHKQGVSFRWHHLIIRPWLAFLYRFLWLQGFRDGWRGFIYCAYMGIYVFIVRAKLWEMEELRIDQSPR